MLNINTIPYGILVACFMFLPEIVSAQEPKSNATIDKIYRDWEARWESIGMADYRVHGSELIPKGSRSREGKILPTEDIEREEGFRFVLDLRLQRHRLEPYSDVINFETGILEEKRYSIVVFNGSEVKWFVPPKDEDHDDVVGKAGIIEGNMRAQGFQQEYWPLFFGHGSVPAFSIVHALPGRYHVTPDREDVEIRGTARWKGRPCVLLRRLPTKIGVETYDEYWIDTSRNSAIVRSTSHANGKVITDIQIQYEETDYGWMPKNWTLGRYTRGGETIMFKRMNIQSRKFNPKLSDDVFEINFPRGTPVNVSTYEGHPDHVFSPIPANTTSYIEGEINPFSWTWLLFIGIAIGVLVIACLLVLRRYSFSLKHKEDNS